MNVFFFQKVAIQMLKCYPNFPIEDDATPTNCLPARKVFSLVLGRLICKIFFLGCGCILLKTKFAAVWLRKKLIDYSLGSIEKEKQSFLTFFFFFIHVNCTVYSLNSAINMNSAKQLQCSLKNSEQCNCLVLFTCLRELFFLF